MSINLYTALSTSIRIFMFGEFNCFRPLVDCFEKIKLKCKALLKKKKDIDKAKSFRCETLQAWSQLIGALFSAVRDGYYQRVRFQRRSSLPQHVVTKQLSIDVSRLQPTVVE